MFAPTLLWDFRHFPDFGCKITMLVWIWLYHSLFHFISTSHHLVSFYRKIVSFSLIWRRLNNFKCFCCDFETAIRGRKWLQIPLIKTKKEACLKNCFAQTYERECPQFSIIEPHSHNRPKRTQWTQWDVKIRAGCPILSSESVRIVRRAVGLRLT